MTFLGYILGDIPLNKGDMRAGSTFLSAPWWLAEVLVLNLSPCQLVYFHFLPPKKHFWSLLRRLQMTSPVQDDSSGFFFLASFLKKMEKHIIHLFMSAKKYDSKCDIEPWQ